jgi:hypothetical protein
MCTSFCPNCGGDFLNDGPVCEICKAKPRSLLIIDDPWVEESDEEKAHRIATLNRLVNLAPDDDGEAVVSMTGFQIYAARERIEGSSPATW